MTKKTAPAEAAQEVVDLDTKSVAEIKAMMWDALCAHNEAQTRANQQRAVVETLHQVIASREAPKPADPVEARKARRQLRKGRKQR